MTESAASTFTTLTVCTANICRSPMAEYLLRGELDRQARLNEGFAATPIEVASARTHGFRIAPMDPPAADQLRRLGGDPSNFRSRPLTDRLCEQADLILTATRQHRSFVLERVPRALWRTFTLQEFASAVAVVRRDQPMASDLSEVVRLAAAARGRVELDDYDIADPYSGPPEAHLLAAGTIQAAAVAIATGLIPAGPRSP